MMLRAQSPPALVLRHHHHHQHAAAAVAMDEGCTCVEGRIAGRALMTM
jgi:hypothetical protein